MLTLPPLDQPFELPPLPELRQRLLQRMKEVELLSDLIKVAVRHRREGEQHDRDDRRRPAEK